MSKIIRKLLWNIVEKMYSKEDHKPWHNPHILWRDCQECHDKLIVVDKEKKKNE